MNIVHPSLADASPNTHPLFSNRMALAKVCEYLTFSEVGRLSATCKKIREGVTSAMVQSDLVKAHFPALSNDSSVSSRGLFLRASVTKGPHAETLAQRFSIKTLSGHTNRVSCLQMSEDGTRALSGSYDKTVKFWDLTTGQCLWSLPYSSAIFRLQMSGDGTRALVGCDDGVLKLLDLTTGTCLHTISGHKDYISCLKMSEDGTKALSGSFDKILKLWDLTTGKCLRILEHGEVITSLAMSPDGTRALSGSYFGEGIKFWDLTTGECLKILKVRMPLVEFLQMNRDKTRAFSVSSDGVLRLWDLKTGECLGNTIIDLQVIGDGKNILVSYKNDIFQLFDLTTGEYLKILLLYRPDTYTNPTTCLHMSADGTRVLSGTYDGTIKVWNMIDPLPEERIAQVMRSFASNSPYARELFLELPQFVQDRIEKGLYEIHLRIGKVKKGYRDPDYGIKALLEEEGFSCTAEERNEVFADYMKRQFLPDVIEYLEESERQNTAVFVKYTKNILFKEALKCFDLLPDSIKDAVYKELYEIKKTARTLPEKKKIPNEYTEFAFHQKRHYSSSVQERVQAIRNVMAKPPTCPEIESRLTIRSRITALASYVLSFLK